MNKKKFTGIIFLLLFGDLFGQNHQANDKFKPSGKPFAQIYTDFHTNFTNGSNRSLFEITRTYLGYKHSFNKYFTGRVNLDVGNPGFGKLQMTAYLKNAYVQYKKNGLTANFGLIVTSAFSLQEHLWGNRYLFKTIQDQNGFNPSADLGLSLSYQLNSFLKADIQVLNGEGYKHLESDSTFKYAAGLTINPVKSIAFRIYYDYMKKQVAQQTLSLFLAYTSSKWRAGVEYSKQYNHGMFSGKDYSGYSLYAEYYLKKVKLFCRYDYLSSVTLANQDSPWNFDRDGQVFIAGIEFTPVQGVKVTPNYQLWKPGNTVSPSVSGAYLSLEINL